MSDDSVNRPETQTKMSLKIPAKFKKPCYYFWICDCSESMGLKNKSNNLIKMDEINKAIPQAIEKISDYSKGAKGQITMRTLKFSDHAEWVEKDSIPVDQYTWKNLTADGATSLGEAFSKVGQALKTIDDGGSMPKIAYPPVLVLITDGYPTDDWNKGLEELNGQFWAQEAVRIAISLEGADKSILEAFIGDAEDADKKLVSIDNANLSKLADGIKLVTTTYGIPTDKKKPVSDVAPPGKESKDEPKQTGPEADVDTSTTPPTSPPDTAGTSDENEPESPKKEDAPPIKEEIIF